MGHDIRAYADAGKTTLVAEMRLFPSAAFVPGNIYEVTDTMGHRRSCSGDGETVHCNRDHDLDVAEINADTAKFLEALEPYDEVWIVFS